MQIAIKDRFMNPDRFGFANIPFKLEGNKEPRADISINVISRSNARSMGMSMYKNTNPCKICNSDLKRVYDNKCYTCWKESKKPLR